MQVRQVNKPTRLLRDIAEKYITPDGAFYLLNHDVSVNDEAKLQSASPLPANELLCEFETYGDAYNVGRYKSPVTNEVYGFNIVPAGVNFIFRINPDGTCEVVYEGACLPLSADPKHEITQLRCYLKVDKLCAHRHGKQLVWVDGSDNPIGMLDVEASIATNSFTTPFFDLCPDECAPIQMCVPEICGALEGEFIARTELDSDLPNKISEQATRVRIRHKYYDERANEWGDFSKPFYLEAENCYVSTQDGPRCIKFRVPIGNPLVDKIEIAFSVNNGQQWFLADTVEKYKPYSSPNQYWYERELADLLNFSEDDCAFDYIFCNDKECAPIDVNETNRVFNPMPHAPQGMFRIKDSLAFFNYLKGTCPVNKTETSKIEVGLNCTNTEECPTDNATVTIRAIIHGYNGGNNFIYRLGGDIDNAVDDYFDTAYFGGHAPYNPVESENQITWGQQFKDKTRNFIGYIDGTNIYGEFKQWKSNVGFTAKTEVGTIGGMSRQVIKNKMANYLTTGAGFFYQELKLTVAKGTKGFIRIASHEMVDGLISSQETSAGLIGTIPNLNTYSNSVNIVPIANFGAKEIYFDTCDGDFETDETFVIRNNTAISSTNLQFASFSGYIKDAAGFPVEGLKINQQTNVTDHNGFYSFILGFSGTDTGADPSYDMPILGETDCSTFGTLQTTMLSGAINTMTKTDIIISSPTYRDDFFKKIRMKVVDCFSNAIGGVRVAISGSKYRVSDTTGFVEFRIRNYVERTRSVRVIVMRNFGCFLKDCSDNCEYCMASTVSATSACYSPVDTITLASATLSIGDSFVNTKAGLKAGGRYGWGGVLKGNCGKISSVFPITVLNGSVPLSDNYMNVPKTQEKDSLGFCSVNYNVGTAVFEDWATCLAIVRTENLNPFELQWIVDKVERVEGKIKLTIQSLNDYNASFNFKTNTVYKFLEGDRVEFISNGDGELFDVATYGLLNYPILSPFHDKIISGEDASTVDYFNQLLIQDNGSLSYITEGAKIELQRPKECVEENTAYFEVHQIPLVEISGQKVALYPTGNFITFDTFFVQRQPGKSLLQLFEHKTPSDFWGGSGISDRGKVHFINRYENEKREGRGLTVNTQNQFNRFGDFEKILDAPEQGDLTGVGTYDGKIGLGVGEYDSFLFQISNEFLQVGRDNIVRAAPVDSLISDTSPKVSGIFGCQYEDIGSLYFGDGFVTWYDTSKGAFVKHDFNIAKDVSAGKMQSYFREKVQRMKLLNSVSGYDIDKYRFVTGFNFHTNVLQFTMKKLTDVAINNSQDALLLMNETVLFEPKSEQFLTYAGYTPEGYSNIEISDAKGCAFLSIYKGNVYRHPIIPDKYNEFFGVACDWIIGVVINDKTEAIKLPMSIEEQSEQMFFVSKVTTDNSTFESEIPAKRFKKTENKWNASFLFDKNSRGGLYGTDKRVAGKPAKGYFIKTTFVRDNTDNLKYGTIDNAKRIAPGKLDMILFKYIKSEQSGFESNV